MNGSPVAANDNFIPDCCELGVRCTPCPGDIDGTETVNAVDLAALMAVWGTDGDIYPLADVDGNGIVEGADLGVLLASWGPCAP